MTTITNIFENDSDLSISESASYDDNDNLFFPVETEDKTENEVEDAVSTSEVDLEESFSFEPKEDKLAKLEAEVAALKAEKESSSKESQLAEQRSSLISEISETFGISDPETSEKVYSLMSKMVNSNYENKIKELEEKLGEVSATTKTGQEAQQLLMKYGDKIKDEQFSNSVRFLMTLPGATERSIVEVADQHELAPFIHLGLKTLGDQAKEVNTFDKMLSLGKAVKDKLISLGKIDANGKVIKDTETPKKEELKPMSPEVSSMGGNIDEVVNTPEALEYKETPEKEVIRRTLASFGIK